MAWQNWEDDDNNNNKNVAENEPAFQFSNTAPASQSANLSSNSWLFTPSLAMLVWPQTYNATPLATPSGAFFSAPIDESANPFDETIGDFGDTATWEDWDGSVSYTH